LFDRTLVMIFEKASTRTRLSFEAGMQQLGGSAIYLNTRDSQLGRGEPVEDAAQVISRMSDIVMIRTFEQTIIERFAEYSRVPVINGLTNEYHPCQILADIFTFIEHRGPIQGKTVAWVGDANNMCNTWLQAAELLDFRCMYRPRRAMRSSRSKRVAPERITSSVSTTPWRLAAAPIS
jgi:ornithine carbamoyltransferase